MKLETSTLSGDPLTVVDEARAAEARGYDAFLVSETAHDPFLACVRAAEHSAGLEIGTGIALAFSRSPMHVAYAANDLQRLSAGRFLLGLGSQVRAHIEKRFSATWSQPARRMREFVLALQAIWASWNHGERLAFRGELYRHTLMPPFFAPEPNPYGPPPVHLAAVGPRMTEVAGEVADGLRCHAFSTVAYLREQTLPALERGLERGGRRREDVEVAVPVFTVTGHSEQEVAEADALVRSQIAFYGSTPTYRPVLELHGWGELGDALNALTRQGRWEELPGLIDDEVRDAFAVVAEPERLGVALRERLGGVVDRVSLYTTFAPDAEEIAGLRAELAGGDGAGADAAPSAEAAAGRGDG